MRKLLFISLFIISMGCKNSEEKPKELQNLLTKIDKLERQNKQLKDSLSNIEEEFLFSQILIGISDEQVVKVGKKNNIVMLLQTFNRKLPKYEIFKIEGTKEIKIGENNQTRFNYDFIPKSINDNELELLIKIPYGKRIIKIPGKMYFPIKE
ncbi:hypothetical protein [Flavobacterium algicola]|uniref:hypothetical protein n=1 Tax=Flavobacterium algicola TaxID=556529 RepID=UPI001EFDC761|nr:hypothetical protein [Flavobacterium algicola]MCG9792636.1 hypothetical protein [Flavobacterium algicola]